MFGRNRIRIEPALWDKVKRYAAAAGYASPEEFVTHVLEQTIAQIEQADSDEDVRKKLKGLGYIS